MDFALTTMFVLPSGNTLPSSGSTQDLASKQFGVFNPDYTTAAVGTIAAKSYIYFAQKRVNQAIGEGTKRSDKIAKTHILEWYKVTAESDVLMQESEFSNFTVQCGDDLSLTLRLHSSYIANAYYNGLTSTYTVKAPCCACTDNPCTDLDPQALVDALVAKINADPDVFRFLSASRTGSGASSKIFLRGKALDVYGNACDVSAYPNEYDRMWFRGFVYQGVGTQEYLIEDKCAPAGKFTVLQRASYRKGTSDEIKQLEKRYYSYQARFKHLYNQSNWNGEYSTEVVDGTYYDTFVIKFKEYDDEPSWAPKVPQTGRVIVAFPVGDSATFVTLLTAYLGAPADPNPVDITTTTTTSTSSTTTTTTTVLNP